MPVQILQKGQAPVIIPKTGRIEARASWNSATDYDLYAIVLKRDGTTETVATFGAHSGGLFSKQHFPAQMSAASGAVVHHGDVGREASGNAQEIITIVMTPDILAVVPIAYSAQSNGTGSFHKYRVSLAIDNGAGDQVQISSQNANNDNRVYTCVIGIIENTSEGVRIHALEEYSRRNSEERPVVALVRNEVVVRMDQGPTNDYK